MTIVKSIIKVMNEAGVALSPKEAYQKIIEQNLYQFKAQNPKSIVTSQIRRHCLSLDFPTANPTKYFGMNSEGKFYPLDNPIKIKARKIPNKPKSSLAETFNQIQNLQDKYKNLLKDRILKDLKSISPISFELFAKKLLEIYGFENVNVTNLSTVQKRV